MGASTDEEAWIEEAKRFGLEILPYDITDVEYFLPDKEKYPWKSRIYNRIMNDIRRSFKRDNTTSEEIQTLADLAVFVKNS